jgi:hypothetical protein
VGAAEAKAALARAYAAGEEPRLVSVASSGRDEIWALGDVAFVLPVIPSDAPPELEYSLRLRREACLTGKCDQCNAAFGVQSSKKIGRGNLSEAFMPHRRNCPAHDDNVRPLLDSYYEEQEGKSLAEALQEASSRTKIKIEELLPASRVTVENTEERQEWAEALIDKLLQEGDRCDHLKVRPAQTWNILLGTSKFQCDECYAYLQASVARGEWRLPFIEDNTCDHCRRYSSSLGPLVIRVSNFVLRGGVCRRCSTQLAPSASRGGELS